MSTETIRNFFKGALKRFEEGDIYNAKENLDIVIEYQQPPRYDFFYFRSLCLYNLGLFDDALKDCDEALRLKKSYFLYYFRSLCKYSMGINIDTGVSFSYQGNKYKSKNYEAEKAKIFEEAEVDLEKGFSLDKRYDVGETIDDRYVFLKKNIPTVRFFEEVFNEFDQVNDFIPKNNKESDYQEQSFFIKEINEELPKETFVRNSIVNYPENNHERFSKDIALCRFADHLTKSSNYLSAVYSNMDEGLYWEIKNLYDFINLRDDIQKIPRKNTLRSLEEFTFLLSFIFEEKIKLFIGREIKPKEGNYAALFDETQNSIVINSMFLLDIDTMCETLTHELIHYLQFNGDRYIPLNIDIEDNILTNEYLSFYDNYYGKENNIGDLLRIELEARTFEYFPNFIRRYKANKIQFLISPQRTYTIQWICNNKSIPNYSESFSSFSPKQKIQIDFKTGLIRDIKKDFFSDNSDQN